MNSANVLKVGLGISALIVGAPSIFAATNSCVLNISKNVQQINAQFIQHSQLNLEEKLKELYPKDYAKISKQELFVKYAFSNPIILSEWNNDLYLGNAGMEIKTKDDGHLIFQLNDWVSKRGENAPLPKELYVWMSTSDLPKTVEIASEGRKNNSNSDNTRKGKDLR